MNPTTALWIILTISVVTTAAMAPLLLAYREEMARAKHSLGNYASLGLLTALLGLVSISLWWYYAITTDQILLAVIPTVSMLWGWIGRAVTKPHPPTPPPSSGVRATASERNADG